MNIVNNDPYSFLWAVTSALYPVEKYPDCKNYYPNFSEVSKYDDIIFPVSLTHVPKFEKRNDLKINIYGEDGEENNKKGVIVSFNINKETSNTPTVHLLMIGNPEIDIYYEDYFDNNEIGINNYVYLFSWIKNLSRLVNSQIMKGHGRTLICDRCLCHFKTEHSFQRHKQECVNLDKCSVIMSNEIDDILKFKNYKHEEKVPYGVYADNDSLLKPIISTHTQVQLLMKSTSIKVLQIIYNVI